MSADPRPEHPTDPAGCVIQGVTMIRAVGTKRLEGVSYETPRETATLPAACLLLHPGYESDTHLARLMGLDHEWIARERCWRTRTDRSGRSSNDKVFVVGDCRRVDTVAASRLSGAIAGIETAHDFGRVTSSESHRRRAALLEKVEADRNAEGNGRSFHISPPHSRRLPDDVVVCGCEGVTAGQVRDEAAAGTWQINAVKSNLRCGMGPCQGRNCEAAVRELIAEHHEDLAQIGALHIRPPIRPIAITEMIALGLPEVPPEAVVPRTVRS